jgi:hypothetical protein
MQTFLDHFAATLAEDAHAVLVLDRAGWHGSRSLVVPPSSTLAPLPSYAPEPNPVERVWLSLRERFLSHRPLENHDAIVRACCEAWNALTPERLRSLCAFPWLAKVGSSARQQEAQRTEAYLQGLKDALAAAGAVGPTALACMATQAIRT